MQKRLHILILSAAVAVTGCKTISPMNNNRFSSFKGLDNFSNCDVSTNANGETVLLSPQINAGMDWNELIVSWNANAPTGTFLKVEAQAVTPSHATKFYAMGLWSPDNVAFPRTSVRHQKDADGDVKWDTLELSQVANAARLRVTLGGTNGALPTLKFLGLSFSNTKVAPPVHEPDRVAWGKIIPTPEKSQNAYPQEEGWCSPTSLTMVLERWAGVLNRPEMNLDVPDTAAKVYDDAYRGTGNWPFNTAYAGSFDGMRAYVTRFNGISELEQWVNAGIPVIISAPWGMLDPSRVSTGNGHLTVCIGFTKDGDVVDNDPGTNPKKSVRHIYKRKDVIRAWAQSHNTVYLVYPVSATVPKDHFGQWQE
jgi:Peptidase_C39 like family